MYKKSKLNISVITVSLNIYDRKFGAIKLPSKTLNKKIKSHKKRNFQESIREPDEKILTHEMYFHVKDNTAGQHERDTERKRTANLYEIRV